MRCHIVLCIADFKRFLRDNAFKLLVCAVLIGTALVVGIYNAVNYVDVTKLYEEKGGAIISYLRNECSAFGLFFIFVIENAIYSAVIVLLSYSDFTAFIAFGILPIKAYKSIFTDVIILRYCGIFAVFYFVLHLIAILFQIIILFSMCAINWNGSYRYKFCFSELGETIKSFILPLIILLLSCVVECIIIAVGGLFI